eukprot:UC1_evm3s74
MSLQELAELIEHFDECESYDRGTETIDFTEFPALIVKLGEEVSQSDLLEMAQMGIDRISLRQVLKMRTGQDIDPARVPKRFAGMYAACRGDPDEVWRRLPTNHPPQHYPRIEYRILSRFLMENNLRVQYEWLANLRRTNQILELPWVQHRWYMEVMQKK